MDFDTMQQAVRYVREMNEEATAEIEDAEVWRSDSGRVWIDVHGVVDNNEDFDGYVLIGTIKEVMY